MKNADKLRDLNIRETWLMNSIMTPKLQYFGHVKCHSGWERIVMEDVVPAKTCTKGCGINVEVDTEN